MEFKFDPINLTVFPMPGVLFRRSNAFVVGLILNRVMCELVTAILEEKTEFLAKIKTTISNLEMWHDSLEKLTNLPSDFSDWFMLKVDSLEQKAAAETKVSKFEDDFFIRLPNPELTTRWLNDFICEAQLQCNSLMSLFGKECQYFSLGLIIDGATNGYTGSNYARVVRKLSCGKPNKKSEWQIIGLAVKPLANSQFLASQPRSFLRRLKTSTGDQLFPFDILKSAAELPPPLEWAEAIVAVWSALAKEDQEEAGFNRVKLDCGEIYLDGQLLGVLPRDNHPYIAFKYIVRELQNDPTTWFISEKVYREIYKEKPVKASKRKGASKTSSGRPISPKTNSMRGETKTPEYGKLHIEIERAIGNIFEKIDSLNTRNGFTLRITRFSKAVLT